MLRIFLFNQLQLFLADAPCKFMARPKTLPLFAYLLLHRAQPIARETLAYTLWPDDSESNARANLRRHLHHLQRALPPADPGHPWWLGDTETIRGLGVTGIGIVMLGADSIITRRATFDDSETNTSENYTGFSAVMWGVCFVLVGLALNPFSGG